MKEVEVKARLNDAGKVQKELEALGCEFSEPVTQDDTVYAERIGSIAEYNANSAFLRLRTSGTGEVLFTLKYDHESQGDPHTTPLEHEVVVSSREEMETIITVLGYQPVVRITKTRMKTKYQQWEICLDEVEGLGSFIELEEMADLEADTKSIHAAMLAFLETLGIHSDDMFTKRYDILMLEKQGLQ